MSSKAIREHDAKHLLSRWLNQNAKDLLPQSESRIVRVWPETDIDALSEEYPWLAETKLVVKPDQLIKRRGKAGLLGINLDWQQAKQWIEDRRNTEVKVEIVRDTLTHFIVEEFVAHEQKDEYYVSILSHRDGDEILFSAQGGVDVGDVDSHGHRLLVPIQTSPTVAQLTKHLLGEVPVGRQALLAQYIQALLQFYCELHFTLLEINPLVVTGQRVHVLDCAAKVDEAARFQCAKLWGEIDFPAAFGRHAAPEEEYINSLDEKTGASLKLTILNEKGRIWTMVAGGGASVIYADTVADLGGGSELANYGEYSGAPTESLTYQYAATILALMTKHKHAQGKILLIGGGIANFTNVANTFKGIIRALTEFKDALIEHGTKIYVRRGGPNFQEGLKSMRALSQTLGVEMHVYGPETHMTSIVAMAMDKEVHHANISTISSVNSATDLADQLTQSATHSPRNASPPSKPANQTNLEGGEKEDDSGEWYHLFKDTTRAFVYGNQTRAVQNMLDFDFVCGRDKPSVAAIVYPFASGFHYRQFYWSSEQIMVPVFPSMEAASKKYPEVDTVVNFASQRSAYASTLDILENHPHIRQVAIIAEGVPERHTRHINAVARQHQVTIVGPATVGGIFPGRFRIGNTGGMLDNVIASKLYRPGSVAFVAKSGGLSNELNNIISRTTDGVYEGVAIGGDRYPATSFLDHLLRYEANPKIKLLVLLGEVGGTLEYEVCEALQDGRLTKPIVAWCTGTCSKIFPYEVQFGHAGACAGSDHETADAKNRGLKSAGAIVPSSFEDFGVVIRQTYSQMVSEGKLVPVQEVEPPKIPLDYQWARQLGLIRKPAAFVSSISDERGHELHYGHMPISKVFSEEIGIGGVLGLLWFRRRLPSWASKFIEVVLMVTADHGPAVSGAHNTIVTARAGKDLISSLCSGLLTIGPRFGGALDQAATDFSWGHDSGYSTDDFVQHMRKNKKLIMGIGHKVKSLENPDARVTVVVDYCREHFPRTPVLDYALGVQQVTTQKKSNLILNVDGAIGAAFVDLLRNCDQFSREEADDYVSMGALNGLFVLGRSIGFIGHFLDQKRLKQGLYRHPVDDIAYILNENMP